MRPYRSGSGNGCSFRRIMGINSALLLSCGVFILILSIYCPDKLKQTGDRILMPYRDLKECIGGDEL